MMKSTFSLGVFYLLAIVIAPIATARADLIGYWPFEDGQGPVVQDASGNDNHGQLTDTAAFTDDGKFGAALNVGTFNNGQLSYSTTLRIAKTGLPVLIRSSTPRTLPSSIGFTEKERIRKINGSTFSVPVAIGNYRARPGVMGISTLMSVDVAMQTSASRPALRMPIQMASGITSPIARGRASNPKPKSSWMASPSSILAPMISTILRRSTQRRLGPTPTAAAASLAGLTNSPFGTRH